MYEIWIRKSGLLHFYLTASSRRFLNFCEFCVIHSISLCLKCCFIHDVAEDVGSISNGTMSAYKYSSKIKIEIFDRFISFITFKIIMAFSIESLSDDNPSLCHCNCSLSEENMVTISISLKENSLHQFSRYSLKTWSINYSVIYLVIFGVSKSSCC